MILSVVDPWVPLLAVPRDHSGTGMARFQREPATYDASPVGGRLAAREAHWQG